MPINKVKVPVTVNESLLKLQSCLLELPVWCFGLLACLMILAWLTGIWLRSKALRRMNVIREDCLLAVPVSPQFWLRSCCGGLGLLLVAIACLLLRHSSAPAKDTGKSAPRRVLLLLDVSLSMLATDESPNRFGFCLDTIRRLLQHSDDATEFALAVTAQRTVQLSPFTRDRNGLLTILEGVDPETYPYQGTSWRSLRHFLETFDRENGTANTPTFVLFFSDGEFLDTPQNAQNILQLKTRLQVHTIGCGNPHQGSFIQLSDNRLIRYRGEPVRTRQRPDVLQTLSRQTNGRYFAARSPDILAQNLLSLLAQPADQGLMHDLFENTKKIHFPPVFILLIGTLLILFWLMMLEVPWIPSPRAFRHPDKLAALLILCLLPIVCGSGCRQAGSTHEIDQLKQQIATLKKKYPHDDQVLPQLRKLMLQSASRSSGCQGLVLAEIGVIYHQQGRRLLKKKEFARARDALTRAHLAYREAFARITSPRLLGNFALLIQDEARCSQAKSSPEKEPSVRELLKHALRHWQQVERDQHNREARKQAETFTTQARDRLQSMQSMEDIAALVEEARMLQQQLMTTPGNRVLTLRVHILLERAIAALEPGLRHQQKPPRAQRFSATKTPVQPPVLMRPGDSFRRLLQKKTNHPPLTRTGPAQEERIW